MRAHVNTREARVTAASRLGDGRCGVWVRLRIGLLHKRITQRAGELLGAGYGSSAARWCGCLPCGSEKIGVVP